MSFQICNSVNHLMTGFKGKWCVAGGWAIDLYLDKQTREHTDIEVLVLREDQEILKTHLMEWEISKVEEGSLSVWKDELLELPVHELHATHKVTGQKLEILLNETDKDNWVFRRDTRIIKPLSEIISFSKNGVPYLIPEIVLLYKAKINDCKDNQDFEEVIHVFGDKQKKWLKDALNIHLPNHEWLMKL